MPWWCLARNVAYYGLFSLAIVAELILSPARRVLRTVPLAAALPLWALCQAINAAAHVQLRRHRLRGPPGARTLPDTPLFRAVLCPNYTAEIVSWTVFSLAAGLVSGAAFTIVGARQMRRWAATKRRRLLAATPSAELPPLLLARVRL